MRKTALTKRLFKVILTFLFNFHFKFLPKTRLLHSVSKTKKIYLFVTTYSFEREEDKNFKYNFFVRLKEISIKIK